MHFYKITLPHVTACGEHIDQSILGGGVQEGTPGETGSARCLFVDFFQQLQQRFALGIGQTRRAVHF